MNYRAFFTVFIIFLFGMPAMLIGETVGIFFDSSESQSSFAAGDAKVALESMGHTVEMITLSSLTPGYTNRKVVIAQVSNETVTAVLTEQGGTIPGGLGEQAYGLRTTTTPQLSFWAIGGDATGAMYGGLQITENIKFNGLSGSYNSQESPAMLKRGLKLNLPFDAISTTYQDNTTAAKMAIPNVWDMTFWTTYFDEMARNRYNVISIWNDHPFTSLIKMDDYPNAAIQNVTGFDGYFKTMSIDEKIVFWKEVMAYAHSRGFEFLFITWNLYTHGATGKYGITEDVNNGATVAYMRKCMSTLFETYPDLDGFGITQGEHMSSNDAQNAAFLGKTYGMGMADYAKAHPKRKLRFIHRWHSADFSSIKSNFSPIMNLPNVTFDMSYKYSIAHMYGTPYPEFFKAKAIADLTSNDLMSWLTLRNDDFYYHDWGDPDYARVYLNGILDKGDWFRGFNMGSDGFQPTRTFFSKNSVTQGLLEVQRQWYMMMIWGRLSYNPETSNEVFKNYLGLKFPQVSSENLFTAWRKVSSTMPKITELIQTTMRRDSDWWPEACQTKRTFITVEDFSNARPGPGSLVCSIDLTGSDNCDGKKTSFQIADEVEADALSALSIINNMSSAPNTMLGVTINNIRSMSYLALYYVDKIRAATYLKAGRKSDLKEALGSGYCNWKNYSNLMGRMYDGMELQKSLSIPDWDFNNSNVLAEIELYNLEVDPSDKK
ncbi:hypothetical protein ACFL6U_01435 [Planctomycetota bacterium]